MSLLKKIGVAAVVVLGTIALAVAGIIAFFEYATPKRNRYLIPDGYAGWLCVRYGVKGAPALEMEDGFRLVQFPLNGYVETSSELRGGKMKDEFFYSGDGRRLPVNMAVEMGGGYTTSYPTGESIDRFWVSRNARSDYLHYVESKPGHCGPFEGYKNGAKFNPSMHTETARQ